MSRNMAKKNAVAQYLAKIGKKGGKASGKARMTKMTPAERSEVGKKAAAARWGKKLKKQRKPGGGRAFGEFRTV